MATMNISLPEPLKEYVDRKVSEAHYGTASEYVRELIRRDQDRARLATPCCKVPAPRLPAWPMPNISTRCVPKSISASRQSPDRTWSFRSTKGAVKLHLVLDHDGYLPCFGIITDGKAAYQMHFAPGTIVVDDRGYNDYRLFAKWTDAGVYFVTRMKDSALFEVIEDRAVPTNRNILKDQIIRLSGTGTAEKCPHLLRRVEAVREDTGDILVFITNHLGLGASTIAAIYKDRWQIELFFKALKQNLKIKTFVGTSANAVKTQIWTAPRGMIVKSRHNSSEIRFSSVPWLHGFGYVGRQ